MKLEQIAKHEGVTVGTIVDRLSKQAKIGELSTVASGLVTQEEFHKTAEALLKLGSEKLKPIHKATGVNYHKLRLIRAELEATKVTKENLLNWKWFDNQSVALVEGRLQTIPSHTGLGIVSQYGKGGMKYCSCKQNAQHLGLMCKHVAAYTIEARLGPLDTLWSSVVDCSEESWYEVLNFTPCYTKEGIVEGDEGAVEWYKSSGTSYLEELLHQMYMPTPYIWWHEIESNIVPSPTRLERFKVAMAPETIAHHNFWLWQQPNGLWSCVNRLAPTWNRLMFSYWKIAKIVDMIESR